MIRRVFPLFALLALLAACAGPPVKPQTANQTIYQAEMAYTAALSVLVDVAAAGKMRTGFYVEKVKPLREEIETALDIAHGVLPNIHAPDKSADPLVRALDAIARLRLLFEVQQ